jgi:hypothetical protein
MAECLETSAPGARAAVKSPSVERAVTRRFQSVLLGVSRSGRETGSTTAMSWRLQRRRMQRLLRSCVAKCMTATDHRDEPLPMHGAVCPVAEVKVVVGRSGGGGAFGVTEMRFAADRVNAPHTRRGRIRLNAVGNARSAARNAGRGCCRRSTAELMPRNEQLDILGELAAPASDEQPRQRREREILERTEPSFETPQSNQRASAAEAARPPSAENAYSTTSSRDIFRPSSRAAAKVVEARSAQARTRSSQSPSVTRLTA